MAEHQQSSQNSRYRTAAVLVLCLVHGLAIYLFSYRMFDFHHLMEELRYILLDGVPYEIVNYGIWLAPVIVVLLVRRWSFPLGICAIPITLNFAMQLYYEFLFRTYGTNPSMRQKGDWVSWLPTILGTVAMVIVAIWLSVVMVWFVGESFKQISDLSKRRSD